MADPAKNSRSTTPIPPPFTDWSWVQIENRESGSVEVLSNPPEEAQKDSFDMLESLASSPIFGPMHENQTLAELVLQRLQISKQDELYQIESRSLTLNPQDCPIESSTSRFDFIQQLFSSEKSNSKKPFKRYPRTVRFALELADELTPDYIKQVVGPWSILKVVGCIAIFSVSGLVFAKLTTKMLT